MRESQIQEVCDAGARVFEARSHVWLRFGLPPGRAE